MEIGIFIPYMSILGKDNILSTSLLEKYRIFYVDNFFEAYSNIYFDHKIADIISVNEDLIRGRISQEFRNNNECYTNFYLPYINICLYDKDPQNGCIYPPYKKTPAKINNNIINLI